MNDVWVHNLSPFALQLTESFGVRWYGLAYLAGFVVGYLSMRGMTARGRTQFRTADQIADYITWVAIGVLVGGRLGFALFYDPSLFYTFKAGFPYWGLLRVNEGGMASHGGILGVMLVAYLYGRRHGMGWLHLLDLTVFGGAMGFFFGRLANFVNGELYGREIAEGSTVWAVKFPAEMHGWLQPDLRLDKLASLGPVVDRLHQVTTSAGKSLAVSADVWRGWIEGYAANANGEHYKVFQTLEGIVAAVQAKNADVTAALAPLLAPRYPSQLYQAVLEGLLVFLALVWIWRKPRKPGVIAACFGLLYCLARIAGEQFRMPDAQIGFQLFGLTRGQWLSLAMVAAAIAMLWWTSRRPADRLGGWGETEPM